MSLWDVILDKSVLFSFDQTGFKRHQKYFTEDIYNLKLSNKNVLVTGATAGIGENLASSISKLGPNVFITGRNHQKGLDFESHNKNSKFISLDMANWKAIHEFAKDAPVFDFLVFNAGGMPEKMSENEDGVEFQSASQLFGHYYLLTWLKAFNKLSPKARIVWVSSGGMYLRQLDLGSLIKNLKYEKVDTYANVKRAQVTLVEELSKLNEWRDFNIYSMHPGWVGTEGLKEALPKFYNFMKNRLRSASEGADTILWCLFSKNPPESGGFYFDRKKVSPYISKKYNPSNAERSALLKLLNEKCPIY